MSPARIARRRENRLAGLGAVIEIAGQSVYGALIETARRVEPQTFGAVIEIAAAGIFESA